MPISAERSPLLEEGGRSTRIRLSSSPAPHREIAAERLTDDLLVEILSRVPAKSLSRFKCVCNHWLSLINNPDHRRKLPQTLAGFFYNRTREERLPGSVPHFLSVSTLIDTSFSFLPKPNHWRFQLLDCSNGLLLLGRSHNAFLQGDGFRYVVCNPVTGEWAEFPDHEREDVVASVCLGFDPAVSPHFDVFVLLRNQYNFLSGVYFYSSETERWVYKKQGWKLNVTLGGNRLPPTVYLNGRLHFYALVGDRQQNPYYFARQLAAVDTKGETWSRIDIPSVLYANFIQLSQGRLHYAGYERAASVNANRLLLYVLNDHDNEEWILSHSVEMSSIFGGIHAALHPDFYWSALHPACNLVFFKARSSDMAYVCYDMDRRQVKVIHGLENGVPPYLPFVPLYTELNSLHK